VNATSRPRVSVLTPFYNTADYLAECIESVLAQTLGDFEYVLVDNCSTDGSAQVAAAYAARDPRVRLVHNETFLTQIQNYNRALTLASAQSRYVKIVQADDTIFPACLAEMVALAEAHPDVAIVSAYRFFGRQVQPGDGLAHTRPVMSGREACRLSLIQDVYTFGSPTTVLYRADLVRARQPFYPEVEHFADALVAFEILRDHDFGFVPQILSFSREDDASLWGSVHSFDPNILARIVQLRGYGPVYLSPQEYARVAARRESAYRRFLGEALLRGMPPAFWEFHRRGLAMVGGDLDRPRIIASAAAVAGDLLLQPKRVASALLRRARRRPRSALAVEPHAASRVS
jgi:glycosyltransferase involved in cell wall biosynthesis